MASRARLLTPRYSALPDSSSTQTEIAALSNRRSVQVNELGASAISKIEILVLQNFADRSWWDRLVENIRREVHGDYRFEFLPVPLKISNDSELQVQAANR